MVAGRTTRGKHMSEVFETNIASLGTGGAGIGAHPDGRVAFVEGTAPGDRVSVRVDRAKKRFVNGTVVEVLSASPQRVHAPCPHVAEGCGGCDWQHLRTDAQSDLRVGIVRDALERIGRFEAVDAIDLAAAPPLEPFGYRTTVRAVVEQRGANRGRAGFRARRQHKAVVPETCLTAHPAVAELMASCRFEGAKEVTFRVGSRTGERMVVLDSPKARMSDGPRDLLVAGLDAPLFLHEEVAGHRFRISSGSFFQCRPDGADLLVELVDRALHPEGLDPSPDEILLDAYGGVGLFGATVARGARVIGVESSRSSSEDARVNLPDTAELHCQRFEQWQPEPVARAVADPARAGLGAEAAAVLVAAEPSSIALVSCDPGSFGRDARLLVDAGYSLDWVRTVDLFGSTSHIEVVSRFARR